MYLAVVILLAIFSIAKPKGSINSIKHFLKTVHVILSYMIGHAFNSIYTYNTKSLNFTWHLVTKFKSIWRIRKFVVEGIGEDVKGSAKNVK